MRKFLLIILFCSILTSSSAFAKCNCTPSCQCVKVVNDEMKFYKNYAEQVKKERATVSNALQLTEEQVQCKNELMRENTVLLQENYKKLYDETLRLNNLKDQKACHQEIKLQEKKVNCKFLFTHPNSFVLITGEVKKFAIPKLVFIPDNIEDTKDLSVDTIINKCTLKIENNIKTVNAKIIKNGNEIEFLI